MVTSHYIWSSIRDKDVIENKSGPPNLIPIPTWLMGLSLWEPNSGSLVIIRIWLALTTVSGYGALRYDRWCEKGYRLRRERRSHVEEVEPNSATKGVMKTARWSSPRTACWTRRSELHRNHRRGGINNGVIISRATHPGDRTSRTRGRATFWARIDSGKVPDVQKQRKRRTKSNDVRGHMARLSKSFGSPLSSQYSVLSTNCMVAQFTYRKSFFVEFDDPKKSNRK
jgi:hypothetical protein